jgi:hypothetical protein
MNCEACSKALGAEGASVNADGAIVCGRCHLADEQARSRQAGLFALLGGIRAARQTLASDEVASAFPDLLAAVDVKEGGVDPLWETVFDHDIAQGPTRLARLRAQG